ncbi:MAG: rhomboid family intramembrane serine protease [Bacteroidales bacterium]|nr:rhomboid family intramembrane serine protease [Bacteroidales bacterium]
MDIAVKRFYLSIVFPMIFIIVIWIIFVLDLSLKLDLFYWGLYPRKLSGLWGILFSPLLHGSLKHIIANTIPIFVLSTGLFYFYRDLAFRVLVLSYIITGVLVWCFGRPSYHIGASGLIYALAGFLFFSGVLRKHVGLMAISLIIVFQYGSLVWGIFPLEEKVSWEGHLMGLVTGVILSLIYRNQGPQVDKFKWEQDDDDAELNSAELPWSEYEVEGKRKENLD